MVIFKPNRAALSCFVVLGLCTAAVGSMAVWWHSLNVMPRVVIPTPTLPKPNAYSSFQRAGMLLQEPNAVCVAADAACPRRGSVLRVRSDDAVPVYSHSRSESLVERNSESLRLVRQGLAYSYRAPPYYNRVSGRPPYESLGMLVVLDGQMQTRDSQWSRALDSYLVALQFGEVIRRGGNLDVLSSGRHIQEHARLGLEDILDRLDAAQLRLAIQRMELIRRLRVPFSDVLTEFKWILVHDHMQALDNRNLLEALREFRATHTTGNDQLVDRLPVLTLSKRCIVANLVAYMDKLISRAHRPFVARGPSPSLPRDPFYLPGAWDDDDAEWRADLVNQTENDMLTVKLALRAYELERGRLPLTLSELAPTYMESVPNDMFTNGSKLRYRRQGERYLLYSIGRDGYGRPISYTK